VLSSYESPTILAGAYTAGQSPALQVAGLTALARTQILARSVGIADDPRGDMPLTITHILGDPLLQSVTTTKSKNNDFLTRCSLLQTTQVLQKNMKPNP
jgi:hypothetical protein